MINASPKATEDAATAPIPSFAATAMTDDLSPDILAIIAAAVVATFGRSARIAGVKKGVPVVPSGEIHLQQWSMEGRRQIYSSHKIR